MKTLIPLLVASCLGALPDRKYPDHAVLQPTNAIVLDPNATTPVTIDKESLDDVMGFQGQVLVIEVVEGKYASNNVTTPGPDPMNLNGLAVFENQESATEYMGALNGLSGETVPKTLEECREIVKERPQLSALLFMIGPKCAGIFHV